MFDPSASRAGEILTIDNALILPRGEGKGSGMARPAGIYDSEGTYVELGQCFRKTHKPTTVKPVDPPPPTDHLLPGTWSFGGLLYNHFGHALLESTGRLWATEGRSDLAGVVFLNKDDKRSAERFTAPMLPMLRMFGGTHLEYRGLNAPVRVERLIVAPQGFGTGDMIAGSPEQRAFIRKRLTETVQPDGAEKIYISRSKLFSKRGRYFGEARIEALFEAEGYRIYHPQTHSLEDQAAQYAAAKVVVSSDSSALHFAAFFAPKDSRLAILLRRPAVVLDDYLTQYRWFNQVTPDVIDALTGRYFTAEGAARVQLSEVYSVLDLPRLGKALQDLGYIQAGTDWPELTEDEITAEQQSFEARMERPLMAFRLAPATSE